MPRIRKTSIVNDEILFLNDDILEIRISESFICNIFSDNKDGNEFLAKCKWIWNKQSCELCEESPLLSYVKDNSTIDGFRWRCKKTCSYSASIRKNSFLKR